MSYILDSETGRISVCFIS